MRSDRASPQGGGPDRRSTLSHAHASFLSRTSLATAGLGLLACLATLLAARLAPAGHPPLATYVGFLAVPFAWLLGLLGVGAALASRGSTSRARFAANLAGNLTAIAAGLALWLAWPVLVVN